MSVVGDLIHDIALRIGEPRMEEPYTHEVILRAMRRVYERLNEQHKVIQRELSIDFSNPGDNDSVDDGYWHLPDDWIAPFRMVPVYKYVPKELFINTESKTYTIYNRRIYFANVDADTTFTIGYYSSGYMLVDSDNPGEGEVNEPEYPKYLQQILLYGTAIELKTDYSKFESDLRTFMKLENALSRERTLKQLAHPELTGPQARNTGFSRDDYGGVL